MVLCSLSAFNVLATAISVPTIKSFISSILKFIIKQKTGQLLKYFWCEKKKVIITLEFYFYDRKIKENRPLNSLSQYFLSKFFEVMDLKPIN